MEFDLFPTRSKWFLIVSMFQISIFIWCYYATFLRLRRECHIRNLLGTSFNLDQFLSTLDAIWPVSDQFKVLSFDVLGWVYTLYSPWGALKNYWYYYCTHYTTLIVLYVKTVVEFRKEPHHKNYSSNRWKTICVDVDVYAMFGASYSISTVLALVLLLQRAHF
jgi:hypothetical protein